MTDEASQIRRPRDYSLFEADLSGATLNLALLRRLLEWMKPYKITFCVSALLVIVTSALQVLLPVVLSIVVIDHIIRGETTSDVPDFGLINITDTLSTYWAIHPLWIACGIYALLQLAWAVTGHGHRMTLISSVINGLRDLRMDLFKHLESRPSSFYDQVAVGRVMTRVTNDVEALYELLRGLGTLIGEFVPFFVALFIMLAIDIELTLILLMALPVMAIATSYFRKVTRKLFRLVRTSLSMLNQSLQENLAGLQVVQLSERQQHNFEAYHRINQENRDHEVKTIRYETLYGAFTDSIAHIGLGMIIWYGGGAVVQDQMTLGGLILFTRFIEMLLHPVVALGEQTNILFRAMASGERIFQALDWDEKIYEPDNPVQLPARVRGQIDFKNLTFEYEPMNPVLENVSFTIHPGETLAIVGPTGSGKSTLIKLLGRFYDYENGQIYLDGVDLNEIASHDLRLRVGVVLQDFHIFSGTIYDNIALGKPQITHTQVIEAAKTVSAHEFITSLPNKYDTIISERGQNLSQGQRQLLAFARVVLANPEILVLDEATASIDTETELLIQDALRQTTAGRTSIIIAHRLQTIQEADRVIVLNQGKIEEMGTHQQLLANKGMYYELHSLQFKSQN